MNHQSAPPIKIIIADDHPIFRDGFKLLLRKLPPGSVQLMGEAGDGNELLQLVQKTEADVIFTDIQMPLLDGIEATRRIKEINSSIQVIALSMFNEDHLVIEMLEAGASGYLLKNTSKAELQQALQIVLEGGVYFTPETSVHLSKSIRQTGRTDKAIRLPRLSERETEIIQSICKGKTNKEIASELFLSQRTIESHKENIYEKTGTRSSAQLAIYAIRNHIVNISDV